MEPEPMDAQERPGKGNDLLMVAITALQLQKPVGEDAVIEKGVYTYRLWADVAPVESFTTNVNPP